MRRPQTKVVYDDNSDEEDDNLSYRSDEDELLDENPSSGLEEEEALGNDSDFLEELPDDDDASYCTESSFRSHSTHGSTPGTLACMCTHFSEAALQYFKVCILFLAQHRNQGALFKMELAVRNRPLFTVFSARLWLADSTLQPAPVFLTFCPISTFPFLLFVHFAAHFPRASCIWRLYFKQIS